MVVDAVVGPLGRRIVRQVVERAAQRFDRAGGDVGRSLRYLDAPEIHRIDEPVRLGAAEVVGRPVRKPVDGGADLRLADGHLEAAHGDVARPVVEAVGVPFLNGYAGQVIHHRRHARDIRLLQQHRFGDDVAREDPGLIGDDAHRFEQPRDLQRDRDRCGGARPDGYRGFRGLETRQNSRDDIVARRQPGGRIGAVHTGHVLLPHAGAGHRHHHTGQRVAVCVDDGAVDRASCLGCRRYCDRQRQQHDSDGAPAIVTGVQCYGFHASGLLSEPSTSQTTGAVRQCSNLRNGMAQSHSHIAHVRRHTAYSPRPHPGLRRQTPDQCRR